MKKSDIFLTYIATYGRCGDKMFSFMTTLHKYCDQTVPRNCLCKMLNKSQYNEMSMQLQFITRFSHSVIAHGNVQQ